MSDPRRGGETYRTGKPTLAEALAEVAARKSELLRAGMNRADRRRLDREERRAPARTAKPTRRAPAIPGEIPTRP